MKEIASELESDTKVNNPRINELEKAYGKIGELEKRISRLEKDLYRMTK